MQWFLSGSIAGSLAARMVADGWAEVTVLSGVTSPRHAVPQGHRIRALLARGQQILDELFTGFTGAAAARTFPGPPATRRGDDTHTILAEWNGNA